MADVSATAARRIRSHCHGGDGAVVDSISGLPDVILQHILTFVPTKYAIRTSLLSKRWRHVWCDTPSLSFSSCSTLKASWIDQTLTRYTSPKIMHFLLDITENHGVPRIKRWIEFAISRHVENLFLSLSLHKYRFPDFFYFNNSSLKQLTLKYCKIFPECSVSWTSLKNLSLIRCSVSDKSMAKILSGCPVLESLTLSHCYKLSYLSLRRSLRLRTLVVERSSSVTGPKHIDAPHIHYLYLRYSDQFYNLVDVSSLTEADVNICTNELSCDAGVLQSTVMSMLEKLQHLEKLTFGGNLLQANQVIRFFALQGAQLTRRSKDALLWDKKSEHLISFVVLVLKNTKALENMFLVLTKQYHMFKKMIRKLSRYNKVSIALAN
ncbi:hypothetical protein Bca4012_022156 [Brassica carinata]